MGKEVEHICPICGKPTQKYMGNYRKDGLCQTHAQDLKNGKIFMDESGKYVDPSRKEQSINYEGQAVCITCGRKTKPGFMFCPECYKKYSNKEILVRINNCKDVKVLDESYEGLFICDDAHIVKSQSERTIDNFFFKHNIPHAYEKPLLLDSNKNIQVKPDFTLVNFNNKGEDIYVEYWGLTDGDNKKYQESKNFKVKHYSEKKLTVISLYPEDMKDPEVSITRKLDTYKKGVVNDNR